ncbi:hypothetical protein [Thioalkalivibrio sp.]|uniref:hypothetical protein n=1 Tax=Thioalkalivibrio sp. TaxID=2093813 RepID=UPI003561A02C
MRRSALLIMAALSMAAGSSPAAAEPLELGDAELDAITAGTSGAAPEDAAAISATRTTSRGNVIHAEGSVEVIRAGAQNVLVLRDNAQQNLGALINVNAAGAPVNVLLNLNVNINSNVGSMHQLNINGTPGNLAVTPGGGG